MKLIQHLKSLKVQERQGLKDKKSANDLFKFKVI